jgi:hypothetical protein
MLQADPVFTQAWHIFVDMCWLRKKSTTAAIVVAIILLAFALMVLAAWVLPNMAGPRRL